LRAGGVQRVLRHKVRYILELFFGCEKFTQGVEVKLTKPDKNGGS